MRSWLGAMLMLLAAALPAAANGKVKAPRVLVFSHTTGFRHASIEPGIAAIREIGAERGFAVEASEDPAIFAPERLAPFDAIVLLSTTSDPKNAASEWWTGTWAEAFQAFVRRGGGVVAIHGAADSHYNWPWYGRLIGGRFARHPPGTPAGEVTVVDPADPTARGVAPQVRRSDEWYYFDDHDPTTHLVATLDPRSIGEADVNPNPLSWHHDFEGGRVFYTAMGHTAESFAEPWYLRHLGNGIAWALRR